MIFLFPRWDMLIPWRVNKGDIFTYLSTINWISFWSINFVLLRPSESNRNNTTSTSFNMPKCSFFQFVNLSREGEVCAGVLREFLQWTGGQPLCNTRLRKKKRKFEKYGIDKWMYMWYHVISCWKKNNVISNQFWSSFAVDVFFFRICSFQTSHGFLSQGGE